MVEFIAFFHGPYFLQASLAAAAPRLDLQLWRHMEIYMLRQPAMARATQQSLLRQLWYLTEETDVLGLFNPEVSDEEKTQMSQMLLAQP